MRRHFSHGLTRRAFLTNTLIPLSAAACSRSPQSNGGSSDERRVPAATPAAARLKLTAARNDGVLCYADWWIASQRGFFAEEALDVEFLDQEIPAGSHVHGGLVSQWLKGPDGVVPTDIMIVEYAALPAMASGELPYYVVAGEHSGCRQIVCPVSSPVRAAADLRGKRIGIWPVADTLLFEMMISTSRPVTQTVQWVRSPNLNNPSAEVEWARRELVAGRIDAYTGPDPIPEILKAEGTARLVTSNTWGSPYNGWYCCMLAVRSELLHQHPRLATSFTRAIRRAAAYLVEQPGEAVANAVSAGHLPPSTPQELSAQLLREYVWTTTGRIQEDLERYFDLLIDAGRMPATNPSRELVKRVYRSGD
jgi:NitT/TauT family transport system substrate-binding protein